MPFLDTTSRRTTATGTVVALGVFALAEVFGSGAELRELEMETV